MSENPPPPYVASSVQTDAEAPPGVRGLVKAAEALLVATSKASTYWPVADPKRMAWRELDREVRAAAGGHPYEGTTSDAVSAFLNAPSGANVVTDELKLIGQIKAFSGVHLRDGTGATDALYSLAVKHGASETEAAGFAHHANGAMNELQSNVFDIARIAAGLAQSPALGHVVGEVLAELERATCKFPTWPSDPLHAVAVLNEEAGELNRAVLQQTYEPEKNPAGAVRSEAVQTAAMALRFIASLPYYEWLPSRQHKQGRPTPLGE